MTWLDRWRYRGRHRGHFLDCYRSLADFAEAERLNARWCEAFDNAIKADLARLHRAQIDAILPPLDHEPTIIFDPPRPVDRSGYTIASVFALRDVVNEHRWPAARLKLWLPGDEVDDDEQAQRDRLMGMAGA